MTGEVAVRAAGRTAQDASSGRVLLRPMRTRRTSGRRAVISMAAPLMVAARPLGSGRDFSTRESVRVVCSGVWASAAAGSSVRKSSAFFMRIRYCFLAAVSWGL